MKNLKTRIFRDETFGVYGEDSLFLILGALIFAIPGLIFAAKFLLHEPTLTEQYSYRLIFVSILVCYGAHHMCMAVYYAAKTAREVILEENKLIFNLYYFRSVEINLNKIKEIELSKVNWVMAQRVFTGPRYLKVTLINGNSYLISAQISDFDDLCSRIKNIPKKISLISPLELVYHDQSQGKNGMYIYLFLFTVTLLMILAILFTLIIIKMPDHDLFGKCNFLVIIIYMLLVQLVSMFYTVTTATKIIIFDSVITVNYYFGRVKKIPISHIVEIEKFDLHWIMSKIYTYPSKGYGLKLIFKDKSYARISPSIDEFRDFENKMYGLLEKSSRE